MFFGIIGTILGAIKGALQIAKENKYIKKTNPYIYYRELPNNFGIGVTSLLFDSTIENYKDIVAVILDLCAKKYLKLVKQNDKYSIEILKPIDDDLLSNERYILTLISENNIKNINLNSNKNGAFLELIYNDKMYYVIQNGIYTCDLGGEGKQCVMKEREIKEIFLGTFDAIDNRLYFLAENLDNKICVYYISLSSFRLSEVVCEDVSCYALGEKGIYYVSEDDDNVYYKTYQNSESIEKTAIENCSNSLLKYGDNGWLIQQQKSVSDGQIYAFNEVKGVSKILFKSNR